MSSFPSSTTIVCCTFSLIAFGTLQAGMVTLDTNQSPFTPGVKNQGWWGNHAEVSATDDNANYVVAGRHRNFFTFDLSFVQGDIEQAYLRLTRYSVSGQAIETVGFFDVSTDAAVLNNNVGVDLTIFNDLGTGASYGTLDAPGPGLGELDDVLELQLSVAAIADLNSSLGGFFSIGGALLTDDGGDTVFGGSGHGGVQQLVLVGDSIQVVPEPTSFALLGIGCLTLLGHTLRRRGIGKDVRQLLEV